MEYKEEYEIGSNVTAKRTYNGEIITGEFGGFYLLDKSDPKSIVGIVHTPYCSYYVESDSIKPVISEDEKMRNEIISIIEQYVKMCEREDDPCSLKDINKCIAWLEKQGELVNSLSKGIDNAHERIDGLIQKNNSLIEQLEKQGEQKVDKCKDCNNVKGCIICTDGDQYAHITKQNPTDKTEPKFKNGQWIVWQDKCYKVNYNGCGYELVDQNGLSTSLEYGTIDENAHIWNIIQDAKDGDVLLFEGNYNSIVLFQGIGINGEGRINYHCKCDLGNYSIGIQGDVACLGTVDKDADHYQPATKKQRDLLFAKMKEAGYEWDMEKKELKKIDARKNLTLDGDLIQADCMWLSSLLGVKRMKGC